MGDVLRWYTRARRIPTLIGKLPGSERGLPGGPYTLSQGVGGSAAAIAAIQTEPLWGRWGFWGDKVAILAVTGAAVLALRFVKPGGRDPVTATFAVVGVVLAGRYGTHRGRQIKPRRPVQVRARTRVLIPPAAWAVPAPWADTATSDLVVTAAAPAAAITPAATASTATGRRATTNLDRILAQLAAPHPTTNQRGDLTR